MTKIGLDRRALLATSLLAICACAGGEQAGRGAPIAKASSAPAAKEPPGDAALAPARAEPVLPYHAQYSPPTDWAPDSVALESLRPPNGGRVDSEGTTVAIARRGPVRLVPGGPSYGPATPESWTWSVAKRRRVGAETPMRILDASGCVAVALYVDDADLGTAITRYSFLAPVPGAREPRPREGAVFLDGVVVEVLDRHEGWAQVSFRMTAKAEPIRGFVPESSVSAVFVPGFIPQPKKKSRVELEDDAVVLDAPGGRKLLRSPGEIAWDLGKAAKGHRFVESTGSFCTDGLYYRGYVAPGDFEVLGEVGIGGGCGTGTGAPASFGDYESSPRLKVAAGESFYERPGGALIGFATCDGEVADAGDGTVRLPSSWGPIPAVRGPAP